MENAETNKNTEIIHVQLVDHYGTLDSVLFEYSINAGESWESCSAGPQGRVNIKVKDGQSVLFCLKKDEPFWSRIIPFFSRKKVGVVELKAHRCPPVVNRVNLSS